MVVPRNANISASSGDGSIRAEAIEGKIVLHTTDGSVVASRLSGDIEVRSGDGAANPYLVAAGLLAAGLDGIDRELPPVPPVQGSAYDAAGQRMPTTLADRKSTRLNSSHSQQSRMPSSA
mgnify:CR=1 FL=1